jgi:hypothetical protein
VGGGRWEDTKSFNLCVDICSSNEELYGLCAERMGLPSCELVCCQLYNLCSSLTVRHLQTVTWTVAILFRTSVFNVR